MWKGKRKNLFYSQEVCYSKELRLFVDKFNSYIKVEKSLDK